MLWTVIESPNLTFSYKFVLTSKTRVAASHILIFMVSDELRNFKPYAIPVRVLKYSSLTDKNARDLKEELKTAMEDIGMVTVGMYQL